MLGAPWVPPPTAYLLDGALYRIRQDIDLVEWVGLLLADDPIPVLLQLTHPADRWRIIIAVLTGEMWLSAALCDDVVDAITDRMLGVSRWTAERMWRRSLESWTLIDAELLIAGIRVEELPPARATAVVFGVWRRLHAGNPDGWDRLVDGWLRPPARQLRREAAHHANPAVAAAEWDAMDLPLDDEDVARPVDAEIVMPGPV